MVKKNIWRSKGKGILSAVTIAAMLTASPVSVFAGEFTEDGSTAVPINATIASTFSVSLPASFTLGRQMTEAEINEMYDNALAGATSHGASEQEIEELEKERIFTLNSYYATGGIGVKGNFPSTKAVVVVAYDGETDGGGNLTPSALATGAEKLAAVNSDEIRDCFVDGEYGPVTCDVGPFTLRKASTGETMTSATIDGETYDNCLVVGAIRWASPALNDSDLIGEPNAAGYRTGEMKAKTDQYVLNSVTLQAAIPEADTYSGYIGFTFGLVDRI